MGADYSFGKGMLNYLNIGGLAAGAAYVIPVGRTIKAVFSTDVDLPDLRLEITGIGWVEVELVDGNGWTPDVNVWTPTPLEIRSDGVNARLYNSGLNLISGIYICFYD